MKFRSHLAFAAGYVSSLLLASCATAPPVPESLPAVVPARYEASFDCNSPESALQDFVCRDEELAALDRSMAREFRSKVRTVELLGRAQLMAEQRRWLVRRETQCRQPDSPSPSLAGTSAACLKGMYRKRITELAARQRPQVRQRKGSHPLSTYVEFKPVDDREPALCGTMGKQFNDMIAAGGEIEPTAGAGFSELAGSHGAASFVRDGRTIEVNLYDAGPYASYQLRAKRLTSNGQTLIREDTLPDWIAQLPNSGGSFSNSSSQTMDYAAIDVFATQGREFVLVNETWGYLCGGGTWRVTACRGIRVGSRAGTPATLSVPDVSDASDREDIRPLAHPQGITGKPACHVGQGASRVNGQRQAGPDSTGTRIDLDSFQHATHCA